MGKSDHKEKVKKHHKHSKESKHSKEIKPEKDKEKKHSSKKDKHEHKDRRGSDRSEASDQALTEDDYFRKAEEFQIWLRAVGKYGSYETLTSVQARSVFTKEFCRAWNKGKLPDMYYQGIPPDLRRGLGRSSHTWSLALTDSERDSLNDLSDSVRDVTAGRGEEVPTWGADPAGSSGGGSSAASSSGAMREKLPEQHKSALERAVADEQQHQHSRKHEDNRASQQRIKALAEEIAPRALGGSREALKDKKEEISAATHGAHKARADDILLSDADIYGGGNVGDASTGMPGRGGGHHSTSQKQQRRKEEQVQLTQQVQQRQQERDTWRDKLGIDFSGGKITIAPREG